MFYLDTDDLAAQAAALRSALGIDWLYRPFSRCLLCNTELTEPPCHLWPRKERSLLLHCPRCDKLYWEGTHVRRMREQLADWQRH